MQASSAHRSSLKRASRPGSVSSTNSTLRTWRRLRAATQWRRTAPSAMPADGASARCRSSMMSRTARCANAGSRCAAAESRRLGSFASRPGATAGRGVARPRARASPAAPAATIATEPASATKPPISGEPGPLPTSTSVESADTALSPPRPASAPDAAARWNPVRPSAITARPIAPTPIGSMAYHRRTPSSAIGRSG